MQVYITNLNGHAYQSTAQAAQNMVTDVAHELGYRELAIHAYPIHADSPSEMGKRIDGIFAGIRQGDVVIFQTPIWNTTPFDERFMQKLRAYNIKIVLFVHDVIPLMFAGNYYLMERTINYYNMADVIIVPSQPMLDKLRQHGLTVDKAVIQGMWDHPTKVPMLDAHFEKLIHFPGNPERFSFTKEWNYPIELNLYTPQEVETPAMVNRLPFRPNEQLLMEMSQGGFGLVWMDDHDKGYQELYCPYKLGAFIAAGIPVFVQKGIANEHIIRDNKLGFVVDSLEEAVQIIEDMTPETYQELVTSVREFSSLVRHAYFTRKLLTDAVFLALSK